MKHHILFNIITMSSKRWLLKIIKKFKSFFVLTVGKPDIVVMAVKTKNLFK